MVYRGKPSPGCALCRARRLKCDLRQPSCSQCIRVNRECSGYRDLTVLRIYDQSEEVIIKAQPQRTATPKSSKQSPPDTLVLLPLAPISASIDDRATTYTFTYYVGSGRSRGVLSFLPELVGKDPSPALQASINAVGLASMSTAHISPGRMHSARLEYSTALLATNSALQDPTRAKSDSTLGAVVMLSMYEVIACHDSDLMGRWLNHVQGATKLIELRGVKQLETPAGLELFTLIRMQIAISNIFYKQYSSPVVAALSKAAMAYRDGISQAIENLYNILVQVGDLSAEINEVFTKNISVGDPAFFIQKALHLDADLASWAMSIDPTWRYRIIDAPLANINNLAYHSIYGDTYHIYPTVSIASLWNNYRQTRIVIQETIRSLCMRMQEPGNSPEGHQTMLQSAATSKQMAADICATVPYHFTSGEVGVGGLFRLLWPLFIAGDSAESPPRMKEWIFQTLYRIGNTMGIQQALMMSQFVKGGHPLNLIPGQMAKARNRSEP